MESTGIEIAQLDVHSLHGFGIPPEVLEAIVFEHGGDPRLLKLQAKGILAGVCDPHRLLNSTTGLVYPRENPPNLSDFSK